MKAKHMPKMKPYPSRGVIVREPHLQQSAFPSEKPITLPDRAQEAPAPAKAPNAPTAGKK